MSAKIFKRTDFYCVDKIIVEIEQALRDSYNSNHWLYENGRGQKINEAIDKCKEEMDIRMVYQTNEQEAD